MSPRTATRLAKSKFFSGYGAGTLRGTSYFDARRSMSRHMYASLIGLVAKGTLFISCIIARALNGRHRKRIPVAASTSWRRETVRYVYVLPTVNQKSIVL